MKVPDSGVIEPVVIFQYITLGAGDEGRIPFGCRGREEINFLFIGKRGIYRGVFDFDESGLGLPNALCIQRCPIVEELVIDGGTGGPDHSAR
ncbi:hypothetical protein D3C80_1222280 [compost metagenome]